MQGFDHGYGVPHAIEKIRITKCYVLGSGCRLLANVSKNNFTINDSKHAIVHRNNWAMPAEMFASARRFRITDGSVLAIRQDQMSVRTQRRQTGAIRRLEAQAIKRNIRIQWMNLRGGRKAEEVFGKINKRLLKLAAEEVVHSKRLKSLGSQWGVESVSTVIGFRVKAAQHWKQFQRDSRRGVHRNVTSD